MRILIVEDSAAIRRSLKRQLEPHVEGLTFAGTGEQAITLLDSLEGSFDTVLSDYDLGAGMNGLSLMLSINKNHPRLKRFGMSGELTNWGRCVDSGLLADVIEKPFMGAELLGMLGLEVHP